MAYTPTRLAAEETLEEGQKQQVQPKSPRQKKPGKKKRWILIPVILAAILAVAAALAVAAYRGALPVDRAVLPDINAKTGTLRADEPNAEVPEGTYRFVLNQQPVMEAGSGVCNLELENVSGNHFSVQCTLTHAETGEELWSSYRLSPGKYIETVELSQALEIGEYPLTLHYRFFDGGSEEIGSQDINVTLYVQAAK